jgi:hypothetical protein
MLVMPGGVFYQPKFTYVWALGVGRFPDGLRQRVPRDVALREIARCFLDNAGGTIPGELARVTGLSRPDAGLGNRALVAEGFATMLSPGTYRLAACPPDTISAPSLFSSGGAPPPPARQDASGLASLAASRRTNP